MKFTVIGAGNGGRAFAAYLASKGFSVTLYNRSYTRIYDIWKTGGIQAEGEIEGFFPLDIITQDLRLAVKDADVILIVTPAFAHKSLARKMAKYLRDGQIIVLNPGRTFGSIEFLREIERIRGKIPIFVGETQTLLFTCRALPGNGVRILKIKDEVQFATFPEKYTMIVCDILNEAFPQLVPVENYLELTLNNIGMLLHPAISLLNAGTIDCGKPLKFYREGASPHVCEVLENIEFELNKIYLKLGLKQLKFYEWAKKSYNVDASNIYDAIQQINAYANIDAPKELITRYFTEDVPTGLVPMASLAEFLDIDTPTINSIIHLSSIICGIDFKEEGRTIEKLKIEKYIKEYLGEVEYIPERITEIGEY
ncbi:MAG: NAD/NADP octopine/nopaline dehydrogenase family protein [Promethearchaeota archaeon]